MTEELVLKNRVRQVREQLKMRQADLAEAAGVTRQSIIAIEKGRLNPSMAIGLRLARALREPVDYIFYLERATAADKAAEGIDALPPPPVPKPKPAPQKPKPEPERSPTSVFDFF